jgi:spore maturation protein CgeB
MEPLFRPEREAYYYRSLEHLVQLAGEILAHPEPARRVAEAGHRQVLEAHTYTHRANRILELLELPGAHD